MLGVRPRIRQRTWASRARSVALVAALVIAAGALLPLVHGATGHLNECAVCDVFAHNGASVADVVAPPDLSPFLPGCAYDALEPVAQLVHRSLDSSEARAPPGTSVSI
jgi:hypothetical protein